MSCGSKEKIDPVSVTHDLSELNHLAEQSLSDLQTDEYGWVHTDKCDAALFNGLIKASGYELDLEKGIDGGKPYRTPYKDCYSNELKARKDKSFDHKRRSDSTISQDMLVGYLWGFFATGEIDEIEKIRRYSKANTWVIGEGDFSRVAVKPNMQKTIYLLADKTYGGLNSKWFGGEADTDKHVIALHIILRGIVEGFIDEDALEVIEDFEKSDNRSTLFKFIKNLYTDGNQQDVIDLAIEQYYAYPKGSRCVRWLWERHSSKWDGCEFMEYATNTEIAFIAKLFELTKDGGNL